MSRPFIALVISTLIAGACSSADPDSGHPGAAGADQATGGRATGGGAGAGGSGITGDDTGSAGAAPGGSGGEADSNGGMAGTAPTGSGGAAVAGAGGGPGAGGRGGTAGGSSGSIVGTGGNSSTTPPKSDASSTLQVSSPGAGYQVEGNIPYGPHVMQRLDVIYPTSAGPKGSVTLPGVIMFHGGGWIDSKPAALKASMSSFFSRFLKHGFVVCNVEYRLADGSANGATAPAADQDALLAAKWFWDHLDYYHVDKTKYVVTGASAGGQLALMVGMATAVPDLGPTNPADFQIAAIVNGYGPADVTDLLARKVSFAVQWLPASTPNRDALAKEVSPITYVRKGLPPLITVQGADDTTVPTSEAKALNAALDAISADNALHFVAGAGHGFSTPASAWPDAESAMFTFLTQHGLGK